MNIELTKEFAIELADMVAERLNTQNDRLVTMREAVELLHTTRQTLHKLKSNGVIQDQKIGGRIYFKYSELLQAGTKTKQA